MTLAMEVELLHSGMRAGSPDDLAATGLVDPGEWPPSPARLFGALVAADGTRSRGRTSSGEELRALERLDPPQVVASGPEEVLRSPANRRYVVADTRSNGSVQEYPVRQAFEVRPSTRLSPRDPCIWYVWDGADLPEESYSALARRAARIGYLGCSDSPARVRVYRAVPEEVAQRPVAWRPVAGGVVANGNVTLPVPYPGYLDVLDDAFDRWERGEPVRRAWLPTRRVPYRHGAPDEGRPVLLSAALHPAASGRSVLRVTSVLREAVIERYDLAHGGEGDVPAVLHGHHPGEAGLDHASWLALPDVGHRYSGGRIHGVAVLLPAGTSPEVVKGVHSALAAVAAYGLTLPGGRTFNLAVHPDWEGPVSARPRTWMGPSRWWATAFPAVYERWDQRPLTLAAIAAWCEHAGLPRPVGVRASHVPLLPGAVSLLPSETVRKDEPVRPYCHVEVEFAEPVRGPVVLGRSRHFGLGLCAPSREDPR